jgi:uncharacterized OB-fold protein
VSRILPQVDDLNRPFWDACRKGTLTAQRCTSCERLRYPIAPVCPHCIGRTWTWVALSGAGTVYTFAVFRHAYNEAWRDRVPYAVAIVEMDEGVMMIGDIDGSPDEVSIGMAVRADFEQVTSEITLPRFVPVDATSASPELP